MATLLTGVGYIGAAVLGQLAQRGERLTGPIVALENFYCSARADVAAALPAHVRLIEGDVANPSDVARAFAALQTDTAEPVVVYHLAAQPSAAVAVREPELTERTNLTGARVLLEAARDRRARVVFGGSFRVYGDDTVGQTIDEQTPYGRVGDLSHLSKVYVEQLARMIGGPFVSVRLGVTYGLSPIMKTTPSFMTVPNLFCQRAASGQELEVLVDRPLAFIHVADAADALLRSAERPARHVWDVVNAAPEVATISQVARIVQRLAQARGADVRIAGAASSEATFQVRSALQDEDGFNPRHTLTGSLGEVLDRFRTRTQCGS